MLCKNIYKNVINSIKIEKNILRKIIYTIIIKMYVLYIFTIIRFDELHIFFDGEQFWMFFRSTKLCSRDKFSNEILLSFLTLRLHEIGLLFLCNLFQLKISNFCLKITRLGKGHV